ncbi:ankyrin repeat-containing domain protein [Aspergillus germanicus]
MPRDVFESVPCEIIDIILSNILLLDYYNVKLAGSRHLTDVVRALYSRFSRGEYLDRISKEDARQRSRKGAPVEVDANPDRPRTTVSSSGLRDYQVREVLLLYRAALGAGFGQTEIVRLLLDRVNLRAGRNRDTALHYAARGNRVATAELLLDHGAYVNAADDKGQTPLAIALRFQSYDVAELLKRRGGHSGWLGILHNEEWAHPIAYGADAEALEAVTRTHLQPRIVRGCEELRMTLSYCSMKRANAPAKELDQQ